jgi:hypothetical protein
VRKRHRIHLVTHDKTVPHSSSARPRQSECSNTDRAHAHLQHRLRGSLTQNSTTYGILLAVWQRAKGDSVRPASHPSS